eukprot:1159663-Pelagomonas_calceolata.AAC.5
MVLISLPLAGRNIKGGCRLCVHSEYAVDTCNAHHNKKSHATDTCNLIGGVHYDHCLVHGVCQDLCNVAQDGGFANPGLAHKQDGAHGQVRGAADAPRSASRTLLSSVQTTRHG